MTKRTPPNPITALINKLGLAAAASACGVTYQAVRKWEKGGLPRSEWTGETRHAEKLAAASGGLVTAHALLEWSLSIRQGRAA